MDDDDFLQRLRAITGDAAVWDGFDPSSWRSMQSEEGEGSEAAEAANAEADDQGVGYASDDSADIILNLHKLTPAEKAAHGKLNKARQYAAGETAFPRELAELEKVEWKETGLAMGDLSAEGETFVPFGLVENYPHMFVGKANGARAEPLFTIDALHEKRVWDLYYIHGPPDMNMKPVVLVPTYQFEHLLQVVNAKLETRLTIPPGRNEERFRMSFGLGNSPRPRFLGRSKCADLYKDLLKAIPAPHPDDDLSKATQLGLDEFRQLLRRSRADRKRGKKSDKNRLKRVKAHKDWGRSVKRVQRYLGLRGRVAGDVAGKLAALDLSMPTIHGPEGSVLFVAIDIEAYEHNQDLLTEVGIAMLDTTDLQGIPPGEGGRNWFPYIQARHIRVKENSWAINSRYVRGCADSFSFGTSEFLPLSHIAPAIKDIIDNATSPDGAPRPVVLVFHESSADIKYLRLLSYHAEAAKNVLEVVDTREMHQYLIRSNDSASLATVLNCLGIGYRHLHNAGNDAVYTLQAMIGLAVVKMKMSGKEQKVEVKGHVPVSEMKEKEGWTSDEDTDGGEPVGLVGSHVGGWASEDAGSKDWVSEDAGSQDWGDSAQVWGN